MAGKVPGTTATVVNPAEPPFSIGGATVAGEASGKSDFVKNTQGGQPATGGNDFVAKATGSATPGGGRDFTAESRAQQGKPEVVPNPQEIPSGGKTLLADPGPVSTKVSGTAQHVERAPFKNLK